MTPHTIDPALVAPRPAIRPGTVFVYALTCGVLVGNLYVCQPLLDAIGRGFGVPGAVAGLVNVAAQVGYALGILLLVPLADIVRPPVLLRRLILVTAAGLLAAAAAPTVWVLIGASLVFAAATVVPQVLVPLATALVAPERRARVIASLQTGFVLGILLSRTVSGAVAGLAGTWRAPFVLAACGSAAMALVVLRFLPAEPPSQAPSYPALLRSLLPLVRHRALRTSMALGFCMFGAFSTVWATLAFHLASPPFGLGVAAIGLFGLWGAPGAILAPFAGRLADRLGPRRVNMLSLACAAAALVLAGVLGRHSIWALLVAVNLLDFGNQSGQIANQTRIFAIGSTIRGRLNTVYMVCAFSGGAVGSLGGALAWRYAGWPGVCGFGLCLVGCGGLTLLTQRESPG